MGCVSSSFLEDEERIVRPALGHHIVSLTSTTYGLLTTLDHSTVPQTPSPPTPPPPPPPPPMSPSLPHLPLRSEPEIINSWELMADLDLSTPTNTPMPRRLPSKQHSHSHSHSRSHSQSHRALFFTDQPLKLEKSEHTVVLYTTTLRGVRKTFEDCNAVRSVLQGLGVAVKEKDVSMDLGFLEELRRAMKGRNDGFVVPRLFVKGRYVGGVEEVMRLHEEGGLAKLVEGLPKVKVGAVCDGCGGVLFLPCFQCSGSRKVVVVVEVGKAAAAAAAAAGGGGKEKVVRCPECNENGLVLCPICS
ncbi:putative glutaredoxin, Thioredoxin-like superfamily [Dioscorea sansibarensis]